MEDLFEKALKKYDLNLTEEGKTFLRKIFEKQEIFVSKILEKESEEDFLKEF